MRKVLKEGRKPTDQFFRLYPLLNFSSPLLSWYVYVNVTLRLTGDIISTYLPSKEWYFLKRLQMIDNIARVIFKNELGGELEWAIIGLVIFLLFKSVKSCPKA